jgi:hypothetical protein
MNPLTLLDKTWIHLQLLTWHMNPLAWQEISIHLYCMKKHLNPIAELDWHMNPHTLLGKTYESTYTAWQDMNPLTVNDMTWIHLHCLTKHESIYSYWHDMNPHAWQEISIHLYCMKKHLNQIAELDWHMNPHTLLGKTWIHLQLLTWHMNPLAWQEISIHLHCMKKHLNPIAELDWYMNPHTLLGKTHIHLYCLTRHMNPLILLDKTYECT